MKVLITGGAGMLGKELTQLLTKATSWQLSSLDLPEMDITNPTHVSQTLSNIRPDVVINCAAHTDVDRCEKEPTLAFQVNAEGPRLLANSLAKLGALLVQVSTDFVFDGTKTTPYTEEDEPNPLSVYGKSKLAGELAVKKSGCDHIVARTAWLYGPYGKNFIWSFVIRRARDGESLPLVTDQVGSPSYTLDVADAIMQLVQARAHGLFHVANSGFCSRLDFAKAALKEAGLKADIVPIMTKELSLPAPRPAYSALSSAKLAEFVGKSSPHWQVSLGKFIKRMIILDKP
jgi:dTDP-4-dehydrorhamnose reductase